MNNQLCQCHDAFGDDLIIEEVKSYLTGEKSDSVQHASPPSSSLMDRAPLQFFGSNWSVDLEQN